MEFLIICAVVGFVAYWLSKSSSGKLQREIAEYGRVLHAKAKNVDELYREIVEKELCMNRVEAYEIAYNSFGMNKNKMYVVNREVDSFFVEHHTGEVQCQFYNISRSVLNKILRRYFYEKNNIWYNKVCDYYFGIIDTKYAYLVNSNKHKVFDNKNGFQYGLVMLSSEIVNDVDDKKIAAWIYAYLNDLIYEYIEYDFLNGRFRVREQLMYKGKGGLEGYRKCDYIWKNIDNGVNFEKEMFAFLMELQRYYRLDWEAYKKAEKNKYISIDYINGLDDREFELYIAELFNNKGYTAEVTSATNDEGRDVVACKDNNRYYIECKSWHTNNVGREVIQKLVGATAVESVYKCICITTRKFTNTAIEYAERVNIQKGYAFVELWDMEELIRFASEEKNIYADAAHNGMDDESAAFSDFLDKIGLGTRATKRDRDFEYRTVIYELGLIPKHYGKKQLYELKSAVAINNTISSFACPVCGEGRLNLRNKESGLFWECSQYPLCKASFPDEGGKPHFK